MRFLRGIIALGATVLLALSVTGWVDLITPAWWPVAQALARPVLLAAIAGVVIALVLRAWWSSLAFILAGAFAALVIVNFSVPACDPTGRAISVISLNLEYSGAPVAQVAAEAASRDADLLVLTEVDQQWLDDFLATEIGASYKYRAGEVPDKPATAGTAILSRIPGESFEVEQSANTFGQPAMELDVDGTPVLVRGVHPKPPIPSMLVDWHAGLNELGDWQRSTRGQRLIMAGDFNATRAHPVFRYASQQLDSAVGRIGRATWPADRWYGPFAEIDHVLTRGLGSKAAEHFTVEGTDHRGVWVELALCR